MCTAHSCAHRVVCVSAWGPAMWTPPAVHRALPGLVSLEAGDVSVSVRLEPHPVPKGPPSSKGGGAPPPWPGSSHPQWACWLTVCCRCPPGAVGGACGPGGLRHSKGFALEAVGTRKLGHGGQLTDGRRHCLPPRFLRLLLLEAGLADCPPAQTGKARR